MRRKHGGSMGGSMGRKHGGTTEEASGGSMEELSSTGGALQPKFLYTQTELWTCWILYTYGGHRKKRGNLRIPKEYRILGRGELLREKCVIEMKDLNWTRHPARIVKILERSIHVV